MTLSERSSRALESTKCLCDPRSPFWFRWAPCLLITTLLLSMGWMVALAFLMKDRIESLGDTQYAKDLEVTKVAMAHCVFFGCAIPMLLDIFLDFVDQRLRKKTTDEVTLVHFRTRAMLLISSLAVTSVYGGFFLFGDSADLRRLPLVYALTNYSAKVTILATIVLPVLTLRVMPPMLLLAGCILQFVATPLTFICLLSPNQVLLRTADLLRYGSYLLLFVCLTIWGRDLWARFKKTQGTSPFKIKATEFICLVYCSIFLLWAILNILAQTLGVPGRNQLCYFVGMQILSVVPMTIIPGRIASADAHSRLQTLSQKQAFVRYVSHEIRSPLSIVSAGLEIFVERLNEEDTTTPPPPSAGSALGSAPAAAGSNTSSKTCELLELANDLSEANDAAVNILNDLLQYESMDAGMFKLEAARVEVADLFKAKALAIIAKRHSLTLKMVQPAVEDGIFVLADVYRIEQVVRNLVTNACKFTPAGGTITIEAEVLFTAPVALHDTRSARIFKESSSSNLLEVGVPSFAALHAIQCGSLRMKVSDTGVGIEEHNKDKLFKQFQQFDKNLLQSGGGSGLGLWISHYIVDCHGGKLQFESLGPGKGSVFFFDLPLYDEQKGTMSSSPKIDMVHWPTTNATAISAEVNGRGPLEEEETLWLDDNSHYPRPHQTLLRLSSTSQMPSERMSGSVSPSHTGSTDGTAHNRVAYLIVDDSKGNRRLLRRMLESDKSIPVSSIQEAEDGVDAVKIVAEAGSAPDKPPIDCIFMDSVMNQMHGPETVKHLRSKLGFTGKILGLTGNAMEDDVKHFQQTGLDLLLIKPLKKARLLEALAAQGLMPTQQVPAQAPNESTCATSTAAATEDAED